MTMATITSKGQITIPKEIRDSLLLRNGDKVDFTITDQGEVLIRPLSKRVAAYCRDCSSSWLPQGSYIR